MRLPKFDIRFLYVMYSYSFLYRFKCGITNNVERRRIQIEQELSAAMNRQVRVRVAMHVPSLFSETQEAKIHRWLSRIRDRGMVQHAGYSEWFWYINPMFAALLFFALRQAGASVTPCHIALFALIPVFPADAALLVFAVFFIEIVLFLAAVAAVCFITFHAYQFFAL